MKLQKNTVEAGGKTKHPWWRKKKFIALVIFCVALAVAIKVVTQPVKGHNVSVDGTLIKPLKSSHEKLTPALHSANSYYQLNLPAGYTAQTPNTNVQGLLVSQLVTKPGSLGSLLINIAVKNTPEGGWQNDSSYRLRQQNPAEFSLSSQTVGADKVVVGRDNQTASLVVFWPHDGYLATIGISSSIDNPSSDEITEENSTLNVILGAWQWL